MSKDGIMVRIATPNDTCYANEIVQEMESSAIARGTGIAKRSPEMISRKIQDQKAVIAVTESGEWVGFSYLEAWENARFVSNSGMIVAPRFRHSGVATAIKEQVFQLSRRLYPQAKIFSITSGVAIMRMNTRLGFEPVTYAEITRDEKFWEGCKSCVNCHVLESQRKRHCLCTAMLFDPEKITAIPYSLS